MHIALRRGHDVGVDHRGLVALSLVALFRHRLRAQLRVNERRHFAVALHDVDVNLFRGKCLDVCEEGVPQKRMYRGRGSHHFGKVARLVNVNLVRHTLVSSYRYFRKIPMLRKATSMSAAVMPSGSTRLSAKYSPVSHTGPSSSARMLSGARPYTLALLSAVSSASFPSPSSATGACAGMSAAATFAALATGPTPASK